jgi:hypothetical protein
VCCTKDTGVRFAKPTDLKNKTLKKRMFYRSAHRSVIGRAPSAYTPPVGRTGCIRDGDRPTDLNTGHQGMARKVIETTVSRLRSIPHPEQLTGESKRIRDDGCSNSVICVPLALGVEAVKAGRSVYFSTLADIIAPPGQGRTRGVAGRGQCMAGWINEQEVF